MVISGIREENGRLFEIDTKEEGKTLLAILQEHQIPMDVPCNGNGTCGRCRVHFLTGVPEASGEECRLLTQEERIEGIRLACAAVPSGDCRIVIPRLGAQDIAVLSGTEKPFREMEVFGRRQKMEEGSYGNAGNASQIRYGIAIDIGTTTLAAALVELETGAQLAAETSVNHQRAYGADVISRIQASNEGKGELLRACILADLEGLMTKLVEKTGIRQNAVEKIAIAGNTAMCHLLRGLSCRTLGMAPFIPTDLSFYFGTCRELFGSGDFQADVIVLPGISAFVGADIVAGIYSSGMAEQEKRVLLLDIGTNGEMVLGNSGELLVTSAAAGPVFEGGAISCGVPGIPGAISHVSLKRERQSFAADYQTIGDRTPVGLCGTGIIDLTGELVREHLIDENGMLAEPWFETGFPVAGKDIRFTQRDIRELQMGKSAIRAGIETLIQEMPHAEWKELSVYLAGGFGHFMNVDQAVNIGLFPAQFKGCVTALGNSSLEGAKRFLLEDGAEKKMKRIVGIAKEINLAMHPKFNELYMQHMFF